MDVKNKVLTVFTDGFEESKEFTVEEYLDVYLFQVSVP